MYDKLWGAHGNCARFKSSPAKFTGLNMKFRPTSHRWRKQDNWATRGFLATKLRNSANMNTRFSALYRTEAESTRWHRNTFPHFLELNVQKFGPERKQFRNWNFLVLNIRPWEMFIRLTCDGNSNGNGDENIIIWIRDFRRSPRKIYIDPR